MIWTLRVDGKPVPKARPRSTRTGHMYTPKTTADYEGNIAQAWQEKYPDMELLNEPLAVSIGISRTGAHIIVSDGAQTSSLRGDVDNYCKAIMDGLNGVAYTDDKWITSLIGTKV